jgi:hypothetical protein
MQKKISYSELCLANLLYNIMFFSLIKFCFLPDAAMQFFHHKNFNSTNLYFCIDIIFICQKLKG